MAYQADTFENDAFQMAGALTARGICRPGDFLPYLASPGEAPRQYLLIADDGLGINVLADDNARTSTQLANRAQTAASAGDFGGGT